MAKSITFKSNDLLLEGVCHFPPDTTTKMPGIIVCHPHTLYGGDMNNNVVLAICQSCEHTSLIALRFNFRGAGKSQGICNDGIGEQDDLKAAYEYLPSLDGVDRTRMGVVGYSFGAQVTISVATQLEGIKAVALISPPFSRAAVFTSFQKFDKPKLIITGGRDSFFRVDEVKGMTEKLNNPKRLEIVSDTDHFWWNREQIAARKVTDFMLENL